MLLLVALALQDRWTFDGDAPCATLEGRVEYRESAVGGKALVFNGVDTRLLLPRAYSTFGLWFFALDAGPMELGGGVRLEPNGVVKAGALASPPDSWYPGQWTQVALAVDGLRVNGEIVAEGPCPAAEGPFVLGGSGKTAFRGLIDDLRFQDLDLALGALPWYAPKPQRKTPFQGKFALEDGEVVAFLGGESLGELSALLEEQLALAFKGARFRNLSWEGDTVFERRRDVNFGSVRRSLARAGASVAIHQFGQMESLRGDVDAFRAAYDRLLEEVKSRTRRLVILSPSRFETKPAPLPDATERNRRLSAYVDVCRALAAKHQALFVDVSGLELETRDGAHPSEAGLRALAAAVRSAWGVEERPVPTDLSRAIAEKNRLWFDYWRPMNWAFLEGDRNEQPFSRDPRDHKVRGLAIEMQDFLPLIRRVEDR